MTKRIYTHRYISIMGPLGSGKTTAARLIAKAFSFHLIEENFGENAFLPRFYDDMKRWAFHSQSFFLMEKITQMLATPSLLTSQSVVQDTPIQQDVFSYAKAQHVLGNMDEAEWKLYQKIYRSFEPYMPKPDLIIYLDISMANLTTQIERRGREFERQIPTSYLELLDMLNNKWLSENKTIPVLRIDKDTIDMVYSRTGREEFVNRVAKRLKVKI